MLRGLLWMLAFVVLGCGRLNYHPLSRSDAGRSDGGRDDAGLDATSLDAAGLDASEEDVDASLTDVGSGRDAPVEDAGADAPDPCALCSPDATCVPGRPARCTCNMGFVGDGMTCTPTRIGFTEVQAYLKANNTEAGDSFGFSVALSADGNTLAVGALNEDGSGVGVNPVSDEGAPQSGAVYLYRRAGAVWAFDAYIKPSNPSAGDRFGVSVSLSDDGNTLAVGSDNEAGSGVGVNPVSDDGASQSGAAYVYRRTVGASWALEAYVKASNTGAGDQFGRSVALSGDGNTLAVAASNEDGSGTGVNPTSDNGATQSGAVYVYRRTGALWAFDAYVKASNTAAGDSFGWSVALSGDGNTLAVGALLEDGSGTGVSPVSNDGAVSSGAVYVYRWTGAAWAFEAYIKANNTGSNDFFGQGVALSDNGNTLAVTARLEDGSGMGVNPASDEGAPDSGAVYLYRRTGALWAFEAYLKASNAEAGDGFGESVTLSGDGSILAVGDPYEDGSGRAVNPASDEAAAESGAVYTYHRAGAVWVFEAYVKASNTEETDLFGTTVALSGDGSTLAVGAFQEDGSGRGVNPSPGEGAMNSGAVYVYR